MMTVILATIYHAYKLPNNYTLHPKASERKTIITIAEFQQATSDSGEVVCCYIVTINR